MPPVDLAKRGLCKPLHFGDACLLPVWPHLTPWSEDSQDPRELFYLAPAPTSFLSKWPYLQFWDHADLLLRVHFPERVCILLSVGLGVHSPALKEGCARVVQEADESGREWGYPGQTLLAPSCSTGKLFWGVQEFSIQSGLPERYEHLLIKVEEWNIFYLAVSWLGLHILNTHTYVSELPFISTLTLGPESLRYGPDWSFLYFVPLKRAFSDFFKMWSVTQGQSEV